MSDLPWYKNGLNFKCTGCGKCCTGQKGLVLISQEEITSMASVLGITEQEFKIRYVKIRNNKLSLVEKKNSEDSYDCIFLKNKRCQVYQARPKQCQTFPWWKENLYNEESWHLTAIECEGINPNSPLIPLNEINKNLG